MRTVVELASSAVAATADDPEGSCLTVDEILRLLDTSGTKNTHLQNPLNQPTSGYTKPRRAPLTGTEPVHGDFLVLIYCAHDPFVRLDDYDDLAAMETALASNSGIVNFMITYAIAFIHGRVRPYTVAYSTPDRGIGRFDKNAQNLHGEQPAEKAKHRWIIWETLPHSTASYP
jgi:hypothetical protein